MTLLVLPIVGDPKVLKTPWCAEMLLPNCREEKAFLRGKIIYVYGKPTCRQYDLTTGTVYIVCHRDTETGPKIHRYMLACEDGTVELDRIEAIDYLQGKL